MTKGGKSAATIRRRKIKHSQNDLEQKRTNCSFSPLPSGDEEEIDEQDECYMFDDSILGPSVVKKIMISEKKLFLSLVSIRVVNSLFLQTHYVPDEYWQSLEVAHNMAFGYGYLTWEWKEGLRGYLYPSIFALLYKLLAIFGLDNRLLLIKLPRVLEAILAAWGDLYLYKLSWKLCDRATAQWTLLCQILSWFTLYCATRTLTNSAEASLCVIALYHFPWPGLLQNGSSLAKFVTFASFSVLVRPTAATMWILLCSWHLQHNKERLLKILKSYFIVGSVCLVLSLIIDRIFYGDWILVQLNFLQFNILSGGGAFYGTHPWHWYLTQGFPVVMTTHLYPFLLGAWKSKNKVLLFVIIWYILILSFLSHKEFRFLMPIIPLCMHYCGVYLQSLCKKPRLKKKKLRRATLQSKKDKMFGSQESLVSSMDGGNSTATDVSSEASLNSSDKSKMSQASMEITQNSTNADSISQEKESLSTNEIIAQLEQKQKEQHKSNLSKAKILVIILIVTNIPLALYFSLIHQRGTILVMKHLSDMAEERQVDFLFLMPCHSTPYYSFLHKNISMLFLTCEPNLSQQENYTDEADTFFQDPVHWLKKKYSETPRPFPSHIIYFSTLETEISSFLSQSGYKKCRSFFHTHFPEGRVGSHVVVSCR
ncbi:hypothetical protein CHS0354_008766 [Potamilus streckersoni]|uniref:Mannosyltransferase n=1 Tax=Potamilus streckersoni TaxID=2493646 RepID=A0AAE0VU84_9BIVA|nr:hypothetical protein CHS0354_008766 [Potamilus streckersoni]